MSSAISNIDFSRYLAFGDSITSGYADGALYYEAQQNSFANLLAGQFKLLGGGAFKQPMMSIQSPGIGSSGNARLILKKTRIKSKDVIVPEYAAEPGDLSALYTNVFAAQGPFNNMGVPGGRVITAFLKGFGNPFNGQGNYNPFFMRMAANPATSSMLSDALAIRPTFFTLFIGNNDVMAFALAGGTTDGITPVKGGPGVGFDGSFHAILDALTAGGAKGAVANLPDPDSLPFFTMVPYNGLLLTPKPAFALSERYKDKGILFTRGLNPFVIHDPSSKKPFRPAESGDHLLFDLLLDHEKSNYLNGTSPIPKKYVLSAAQLSTVKKAIADYNVIIKSAALEKGLAFVDVNAILKTTVHDRFYSEKDRNVHFRRKGVFSLDGIHINPFGQALLANEFIKSINDTYSTSVPLLNSVKYRGLQFP
ncbi:MAG: hypothetical protein ACXVP0_05355 [Bacteroidia bacterium]